MIFFALLFFRLFNHAQQLKFTCRIIHSVPLMMSAVQVFFADKMAAVAHLIGTDQLPTPAQVKHRMRGKCVMMCVYVLKYAMVCKIVGMWLKDTKKVKI